MNQTKPGAGGTAGSAATSHSGAAGAGNNNHAATDAASGGAAAGGADKPKAEARRGDKAKLDSVPPAEQPSPTQAELDAMREGKHHRNVAASGDKVDYKTR
jgi:hypothetical protein